MTAGGPGLADRRLRVSDRVRWAGQDWDVSVGFDAEGRAGEIWLDPVGPMPSTAALAHDAAIVASHLLQHGERAAMIAARLDCRAPSLLGLAFALAARLEEKHGAELRAAMAAYRAARARPAPASADG